MAMTDAEIELTIVSLANRVATLEDGGMEKIAQLEDIIGAMADALGLDVGFGPYAVKKDVAEELLRKGVGRIGFAKEAIE